MKKTSLFLGVLSLALAFSGYAKAEYAYVQNMTVGSQYSGGVTTWLNATPSSEDLVNAVTGAPDYVPFSTAGEALGWKGGYGDFTLDFGQVFTGTDVEITFWHFGGANHAGVANNLVYMYVSTDAENWLPAYTQGAEGDAHLEDVLPGGATVFETTYNLHDTFGVDSFRYLMIEKISTAAQTGKFIDAVGVAVPEPGTVALLGSALLCLLGFAGLRRRNSLAR